MVKILLTIIIAGCQVAIYFIPQDKTVDKKSRLTERGYKVIIYNSITVIATIALLLISEGEAQNFETKLKNRDSITDLKRQKEADNYVIKLNEKNVETRDALLRYGYELDSNSMEIRKTLEKAKDTVLRGPDPYLVVRNIEVDSRDSKEIKFKLPFVSEDATTYYPELKLDFIIEDYASKLYYVNKDFVVIPKNIVIVKNERKLGQFSLWNSRIEAERYIFWLRGFYKKSTSGKKIYVDRIFTFQCADSSTADFAKWKEEEIRDFIYQNKN